MKKRVLSVFLAALMLLGTLGVFAHADAKKTTSLSYDDYAKLYKSACFVYSAEYFIGIDWVYPTVMYVVDNHYDCVIEDAHDGYNYIVKLTEAQLKEAFYAANPTSPVGFLESNIMPTFSTEHTLAGYKEGDYYYIYPSAVGGVEVPHVYDGFTDEGDGTYNFYFISCDYDDDFNPIRKNNGIFITLKYENGKITLIGNGNVSPLPLPVYTEPPRAFTDVPYGKWFTEGVHYCYEKGYMGGTGGGAFSPNVPLTRAMFVTVLAKIDGADLSGYTDSVAGLPFKDVKSSWYTKALKWAHGNGYTSGTSATTFGPNVNVSREQLAVFLYNYAAKKELGVSWLTDITGYADYGAISSWAVTGMSWAVGSYLISGTGNNMLSPKMAATRAQVATIVMNFRYMYYGG